MWVRVPYDSEEPRLRIHRVREEVSVATFARDLAVLAGTLVNGGTKRYRKDTSSGLFLLRCIGAGIRILLPEGRDVTAAASAFAQGWNSR